MIAGIGQVARLGRGRRSGRAKPANEDVVEIEGPERVVHVFGQPRKAGFGQFSCAGGAVEVACDNNRIRGVRGIGPNGARLVPPDAGRGAECALEMDGVHTYGACMRAHGRDDGGAPHLPEAVKMRK